MQKGAKLADIFEFGALRIDRQYFLYGIQSNSTFWQMLTIFAGVAYFVWSSISAILFSKSVSKDEIQD